MLDKNQILNDAKEWFTESFAEAVNNSVYLSV